MITFKNKSATLYIATPILGIGMVILLGYVIYNILLLPAAVDKVGLAGAYIIPGILIYLAQIIGYLVFAGIILWGIYRWSTAAIIANVFVTPFALVLIISLVSKQSIDLSSPIGVGVLLFFILTPLIMSVVAYNDIRYRRMRYN